MLLFRILLPVLLCHLALGAAKKPESTRLTGEARNARAAVQATLLPNEEVNEMFGHDFEGHFTVVEVRVTPLAGPLDLKLDDFVLRTDKDGEKTTPFASNQIAGTGAIAVTQRQSEVESQSSPNRGLRIPGLSGRSRSKKTDAKPAEDKVDDKSKEPKQLDDKELAEFKAKLVARVLPEKAVKEPAAGLLFFSLEKQKPKDLELVYSLDPANKIRIRFK